MWISGLWFWSVSVLAFVNFCIWIWIWLWLAFLCITEQNWISELFGCFDYCCETSAFENLDDRITPLSENQFCLYLSFLQYLPSSLSVSVCFGCVVSLSVFALNPDVATWRFPKLSSAILLQHLGYPYQPTCSFISTLTLLANPVLLTSAIFSLLDSAPCPRSINLSNDTILRVGGAPTNLSSPHLLVTLPSTHCSLKPFITEQLLPGVFLGPRNH